MALFAVPKFSYGQHVRIKELDYAARVTDLHFIGLTSTVEYDVRYFADSTAHIVRMFEDELEVLR